MDAAADEQGGERLGACAQCVERCQTEHRAAGGGHQFASPGRHPSFLRTVLEHNVRQNMAIPKAFVQMHGKSLPGSTVDLEGASGKVWLVTVVNSSTGTAVLAFGWHVFAEDNKLKLGDSILFTMVAKNRFAVRVFGKNGLEPLNPTWNPIRHDSTQPCNAGASRLDDEFTRSEGGENGRQPELRGDTNPTIHEIIRTAHADLPGEDPSSARRRSSGKPRRPKRPRRSPDAQQDRHGGEAPGANSVLFASRRRTVTNEERQRALEESRANVATVTRPCVEVVMMPSHVYRGFWLNIPHEFSRQHLPYKRMRVILRDEQDEDWHAQYIGDFDHNGLSGGWAGFSKDHALEEGDVCVFELLDSERFVFRVHICRVVAVAAPARRGPAGWEVTYDIRKPPLPDLNVEASTEATPRPRSHLADVLQEMIRSGRFANLQREEYDALPSKIRALAENSVDEEVEVDEKPEVGEGTARGFQPPRRTAFHGARDGVSVKAELEDGRSVSSKLDGRPSSAAPNCRPTGVPVKAEPLLPFVKPEAASPGELELSPQVAVYRRRRGHRDEPGGSSRSPSPTNSVSARDAGAADARVWYPVVRLLSKRQREGQADKEFLVDLMGMQEEEEEMDKEPPERSRRGVEPGPDGLWWVPSSHFSSDCSACFLR